MRKIIIGCRFNCICLYNTSISCMNPEISFIIIVVTFTDLGSIYNSIYKILKWCYTLRKINLSVKINMQSQLIKKNLFYQMAAILLFLFISKATRSSSLKLGVGASLLTEQSSSTNNTVLRNKLQASKPRFSIRGHFCLEL